MSISGIHGQLLEVTVVECQKLKDTEWISRQDPYVILKYGSNKLRTNTCTDGDRNPVFQEKFVINLIEGLREIEVEVWNSNTLRSDDFIGSGKVQIQDVLTRGYDDRAWSLLTKDGRYSGEIKLIMHYANAKDNKPATSVVPLATVQPHQPMYWGPTVVPMVHSYQIPAYPPPLVSYPPPPSACPPTPQPQPQPHYPAAYPPVSYPPAPTHSVYPPPAYPPPPAGCPPRSYPPPPEPSPYSHSGYHPGGYPPHPY